jgi:hypothetical protein
MKRACVVARIVDSAKRDAATICRYWQAERQSVPRRAEQVPSVVCLDATPERDVSAPISRSSARLRGRIPASGARRGAEEGPLRGSDPRDAHGIGIETTHPRSASRSHPASGSLLHVGRSLLLASARRRFWPQPLAGWHDFGQGLPTSFPPKSPRISSTGHHERRLAKIVTAQRVFHCVTSS